MKRILLSVVAMLAFSAIYGQENEMKKKRLTAHFEKEWVVPDFFSKSDFLDIIEAKTNKFENQIESYAPMFFDTSVKRKKSRKVLLRPFQASAFILAHKKK